MSVGVHVERIRVARPADAARKGGAVALSRCGQARKTLLLVVGCGKRPGMEVAPWTIDGTLDAAADLGLHVQYDRVGHTAPHDAVNRRLVHRKLLRPDDGRTLALHVPGARRPLAVPRSWVGTHACMLVPCVRRPPPTPRAQALPGDATVGPAAIALATLAQHCTPESLGDPVEVGAWLAAHLFASASVVVDATWGATIRADGPHLVATERLFATPTLDAAVVDAAITEHIPQAPEGPRALARRNVVGLGHRPAVETQVRAVRVPGPLARAWNAYPDHCAESSR